LSKKATPPQIDKVRLIPYNLDKERQVKSLEYTEKT